MTQNRLMLDDILDHEEKLRDHIYLTQPIGGNQVVDYTWGQAVDQSRRMATYLQSQGFPRGARIAILSKNCAHFIMAEVAIWMAGYTTVAIFPTETAETINYVLTHSEASLLFVGKLDTWPQQQPGVPQGLPCVAFPLAPKTAFDTWDAIVARTAPIAGRPSRNADELAMLIYTSGSTGTPKGVMIRFDAFSRAGALVSKDLRRRVGADEMRMLSYLPLAHSFERTWVEAASLVDGRMHLFFAEALETFLQDLQRARPTLFLSVPRLWLKFQQGVFAKMPPAKLDRLLRIPVLGRVVAKKVLKGLGLDQVKLAGSGSAPIPPELIAWYRRIGLAAVRRLWHDRGQFVFAHFRRGAQRAGLCGRAAAWGRGEAESGRRNPDQIAGTVHRLLQAAGADGRVVHAGRVLSHRRPRRTPSGRPAQDHRPRQGTVQDREGQVRRAGTDRKPHQCAPDGRTVAGLRRRAAGRLRDGGAGRTPAAAAWPRPMSARRSSASSRRC